MVFCNAFALLLISSRIFFIRFYSFKRFIIFLFSCIINTRIGLPVLFIIPHIFFIVKGLKRNKMKICAIICEYNPFHNGHLYQLQEAKRLSGADAILCVMSGNFVQRGEAAIIDKFTRAKHAVQAGADLVVELPTVFATSNAELFAKGAIHLISSIPAVKWLCFGAETANKNDFIQAANLLNDEPHEISEKIKNLTATGISYAKARAQAWEDLLPNKLLTSPNNILGVEYTKALLQKKSSIEILPIKRVGGGYSDAQLHSEYSSARAIRTAIKNNSSCSGSLPPFVTKDLPKSIDNRLELLEKYAIFSTPADEIAKVCDCTEGLENAFKKAALSEKSLEEVLTSARYTSSRIRRIALQNLLHVEKWFILDCLQQPLYLRVLTAKTERNDVLSEISASPFPILIRVHDKEKLQNQTAQQSLEKDIFANDVYTLLYPKNDTKKCIFV